jgi:L-iditol 2-dehydrogenase
MTTYKGEAAVLTGPGRIEVEEVEFAAPGEGELLVRNQVAAICGSDLHRCLGDSRFFLEIGDYDYPCPPGYPGHEGIGEVVESRSPRFAPGDLVLTLPDNSCNRTFAGYQTIPDRFALRVPDGEVPTRLVMAQQLGTVIFALKRFWPASSADGTAVVVGTGSAGLLFVQMLRRLGFDRVIAVDREPARLAVAESLGAAETVLVPGNSLDEFGAQFAVDASGSDEGRRLAMDVVGPDGRVGFYGLPEGPELVIPFSVLFRKQAALTCAVGAQQEPGLGSFAEALRLITTGAVDVAGHITHTFDLQKIADGFDLAHRRRDGVVKVGITFD